MSVYAQTLAEMLDEDYKAIYGRPRNQMAGYNTVQEGTNFGVLLHKEDLWSLYQFEEEKSLLYHLCRNQYGRFELKNNPCHPSDSTCIECEKEAPEEIQGLWKLHNFEWIQRNGGSHV